MLLKLQAVYDNFVKAISNESHLYNSVESLYSSCHFCQFASNSLRDLQSLRERTLSM